MAKPVPQTRKPAGKLAAAPVPVKTMKPGTKLTPGKPNGATKVAAPVAKRVVAPAPEPEYVEPEVMKVEAADEGSVEVVEETAAVEETQEAIDNSEAAAPADDADDSLIPTPEFDAPSLTPDAHLGSIEGVARLDFNNGGAGIQLTLHSDNDGNEHKYLVFVPELFVTNFAEVVADPEGTLPNDAGVKNADGTWAQKPNNQFDRFRRTVANGQEVKAKDGSVLFKGTAELQRYQRMAKDELGRTRSSLGIDPPTDFDSYVDALNSLLTGLPVIFTRVERESNDPSFGNRLNVNAIYETSVKDNPKMLKKFRKLWME